MIISDVDVENDLFKISPIFELLFAALSLEGTAAIADLIRRESSIQYSLHIFE